MKAVASLYADPVTYVRLNA